MFKLYIGTALLIFTLSLVHLNESVAFTKNIESTYISSDHPVDVLPLHDGPLSLLKRIELIRNAKNSIDLEYFIFNDDIAGEIIFKELVDARNRGVKVRLLLDAFSIKGVITPFHFHELKKRKIQVRYYNDEVLARTIKVQYRDHRKLFIVDNDYFIVGGRNIADEYFDLDERYNFIDREVLVRGDIVKAVKKSFDLFWHSKLSSSPMRPERPSFSALKYRIASGSERSRMIKVYRSDVRKWKLNISKARKVFKSSQEGKEVVEKLFELGPKLKSLEENYFKCNNPKVISDQPLAGPSHDSKRLLRNEIYYRLDSSKQRILIDSPYFILTHQSDDLMMNVLKKGVEVKLLTNGIYSTDALPVASVFNYYLDEWLEAGLKPYVYGGKRTADTTYLLERVRNTRWGTHSKSIVFDDDSVMVGTFNFDPRSAFYSAEISLFCDDSADFANNVRLDIEQRMSNSINFKTIEEAKKHEFDNVSLLKKMGYYLISPLSLMFQRLL